MGFRGLWSNLQPLDSLYYCRRTIVLPDDDLIEGRNRLNPKLSNMQGEYYEQGKEDYKAKMPFLDNPYKGTLGEHQWNYGWLMGQYEEMTRV